MNRETALHRDIMIALSKAGCMVFRNEVGKGWVGTTINKDPNAVLLSPARFISFGLYKGSSDIIGIAPGGRFLAVEVKTPKTSSKRGGRETEDQEKFRAAVVRSGGVAFIARSPAEAVEQLREALCG